jgi:hypothetical protein
MNAPMIGTNKTIYAKVYGLNLPLKVKKLLIGSHVHWYDENPLSQDFGEALHFFFETKTNAMADLLLRKNGLNDVSQFINIPLHWGIEMELVYDKPNRGQEHRERHYFEFFGLLYPMNERFIKERDQFYLLKNMEFLAVADDHKNKKVYKTTKFKATVIGV